MYCYLRNGQGVSPGVKGIFVEPSDEQYRTHTCYVKLNEAILADQESKSRL